VASERCTRPDRRTVLVGGALASLTAACGGARPAPPAEAPGPDGFAPGRPVGETVAGGPGTVLGPVDAVPPGGGVVYERLAVVVTRTTAGELRGLSAVCPHDGCLVSEVTDASIVCPCHGSRFDLDGAVTRGPARGPLAARPVRVDRGHLVLD
jgi:Rieske Fe-S protein